MRKLESAIKEFLLIELLEFLIHSYENLKRRPKRLRATLA